MKITAFSFNEAGQHRSVSIKKLEFGQMANIEGGSRCENVAMSILGFGTVLAFSPFPLTFAVGVVSMGVGALAVYGCPWN